MKKILSILITIFSFGTLISQTPYYYTRFKKLDNVEKGVSAYNPYLGIKLHSLFPSNEISDNFLISGTVVQNFSLGKDFYLPIYSNISLPDINTSNLDSVINSIRELNFKDKGFNVGVYPYYIIKPFEDVQSPNYFIIHGEVSYKYNKLKISETENEFFHMIRFSGGIEVGKSVFGPMITMSATPTYTLFPKSNTYKSIFETESEGFWGFEISTMIPIYKKLILGMELLWDSKNKLGYGLAINYPFQLPNIFGNED